MKSVKIALIDSGIKKEALPLFINKENIEEGFAIHGDSKDSIRITQCRPEDNNGHGTACAITISRIAQNTKIIPISILGRDGRCSIEQLIAALHLAQSIDASIVNMSLSSNDLRYSLLLKKEINALKDQNKICISSISNDRWLSFPALFNSVIGVKGSSAIFNLGFGYNKKKIQAIASGAAELPQFHIGETNFFRGNSRATAIVSGIVASAMEKKQIKEMDIEGFLIRNSWDDNSLMEPMKDCRDRALVDGVYVCISELIKKNKIHAKLYKDGMLSYIGSPIEDYYKIILSLEKFFGCRLFEKCIVYRMYFESIYSLSTLVGNAILNEKKCEKNNKI
ncbi:S8 family serine peptidase [Butyrivibrio sp. MC2013]|uniref:S8 family serine peptidase n=1 Tax=Butyrivibrio sp. MC2013 TaxID=1280686 RepID=UPI0004138EB4|nr:S8 family serine peptidase [Butyrivibrio sp. MC2013]